jgi:hypothetical protein
MFGRSSKQQPSQPVSRLENIASRVRRDQERLRRQTGSDNVGAWFETPDSPFGAWPTFPEFIKRERL